MPDLIQTSRDGGESWTDHSCSLASCSHQPYIENKAIKGYVVVQIVGYEMEPVPEEGGTVLVRVVRESGELKPVKPLTARVIHRETRLGKAPPKEGSTEIAKPPIPTVVFDGRGIKQI